MTFVAGTVLTAAALNSELAAKTDTAMVQNAQTGTSYSYALADASKLLSMSNAASNTVLVTKQATVTWVTGTQLRVVNLGAGVTTLVADTGVTINGNVSLKQYQGGTLIRTASDVWLFVPTASSSGMDLITPTSVAGTGVTLSGGQVSFSAATAVSVNGCFTSAYDNYVIDINVDSIVTTSNYITGRLRAAGTDISTSTYNFQNLVGSGTAANAGQLLSQTSFQQLSYATVGQSTFATLKIFNPARAIATHMHGVSNESTAAPTVRNTMNVNTNSTAYDGISVLCPTAITGTLRIYGLRNS